MSYWERTPERIVATSLGFILEKLKGSQGETMEKEEKRNKENWTHKDLRLRYSSSSYNGLGCICFLIDIHWIFHAGHMMHLFSSSLIKGSKEIERIIAPHLKTSHGEHSQ